MRQDRGEEDDPIDGEARDGRREDRGKGKEGVPELDDEFDCRYWFVSSIDFSK